MTGFRSFNKSSQQQNTGKRKRKKSFVKDKGGPADTKNERLIWEEDGKTVLATGRKKRTESFSTQPCEAANVKEPQREETIRDSKKQKEKGKIDKLSPVDQQKRIKGVPLSPLSLGELRFKKEKVSWCGGKGAP